MDSIELKPIGIIRTPYTEPQDMPIQGRFRDNVEGWIELNEECVPGLQDLEGFSHLFLIYYFHRSDKVELEGRPYLEDETHGIFATRSPHRPNHLGLSIVRLQRIEGNRIYFTEVDVLDGTPLLDIKPYVEHFDRREGVKSGWVDEHFADGGIPDRTIVG
ncbi:MAG TPA: tRNA (N6-threonylcarbamoyladenosine(37)-N6)-methyltransferase TrmO [Anaerolineae bacterium]|jgi:tRNA-Thr(GGU) m(6)t(6)A37 methyltransferase TsaA|nr:tRNA (N6-threonylcarbamoyladenosine(37)-N6)-methyltransferase TrmO [Anaerolineae bacterium]